MAGLGPLQSWQMLEPPTGRAPGQRVGIGPPVWSWALGAQDSRKNGELFLSWRDVWKNKAVTPRELVPSLESVSPATHVLCELEQ